MSVSNHGPFTILGNGAMEFRMFVAKDGIVIVRPSFIRHAPGAVISEVLGGAVGGGIGGGVDGAMGSNEYRKIDKKAEDEGFASAETLTASLPRASRYSVDNVAVVKMKKNKIIFIMQKRELKRLGTRKLQWWLVIKDNTPVQTALRELFGDRFQILK